MKGQWPSAARSMLSMARGNAQRLPALVPFSLTSPGIQGRPETQSRKIPAFPPFRRGLCRMNRLI
jgi:hypothetical protein